MGGLSLGTPFGCITVVISPTLVLVVWSFRCMQLGRLRSMEAPRPAHAANPASFCAFLPDGFVESR